MKKPTLFFLFSAFIICQVINAQNLSDLTGATSFSKLSFGVNVGYDLLPAYTNRYTYYGVSGGPKFGASVDYSFGMFGIGLDYDYLQNKVSSTLGTDVFYDTLQIRSSIREELTEGITRHFLGLGPNVKLEISQGISLKLFARGGYSFVKGGELITTSLHPDGSKNDHHVMFSGLDAASLAFKAGMALNYNLAENISVNLGAYYLNHLSIHPDRSFELNNRGNMGMVYGHTPFVVDQNNYTIGLGAPYIISAPKNMTDLGSSFSSIGINLGLAYNLGFVSKPKKKEEKEVVSNTPTNKILVTVEDEISKKPIPGADVILKNDKDQIVGSSKTNAYGIAEFSNLIKENYTVLGNVYGVETNSTKIGEKELDPTKAVSTKLFYSDLRFILKGHAVNKRTKAGESNVIVSLTNNSNRSVQQESTKGDGSFAFKLDKNTSYRIVGVKENKLSDIKSATTVGLTRSTTLFVNLELGVENFDCNRGTILDIKYEFDKADLLTESKFELDRVIRYMKDHPNSRIQMSAHTDSRGPSEYNLSLSDKRARSAMDYILSRGINSSRVTAQGYGETRLKNHCDDNANCSEVDHAINRRTEATLICR